MKTPKRYQNKPLPMLPEDNVVDDWVVETWCARAKRKNKIAQLKRSLEKYKYGTHLSGQVRVAYRQLQSLVRPGKKATIVEWVNYFKVLHRSQEHISHAISNAAIILAYEAERKVKEERRRNEHSEKQNASERR